MTILTPGCANSQQLSQKIAELEGRVSILHQIKEDEQLIDSLLESAKNVVNEATCPWLVTASSGRACSCETNFDPVRRALAMTGSYTQASGLLHFLLLCLRSHGSLYRTKKSWQENAKAK